MIGRKQGGMISISKIFYSNMKMLHQNIYLNGDQKAKYLIISQNYKRKHGRN